MASLESAKAAKAAVLKQYPFAGVGLRTDPAGGYMLGVRVKTDKLAAEIPDDIDGVKIHIDVTGVVSKRG